MHYWSKMRTLGYARCELRASLSWLYWCLTEREHEFGCSPRLCSLLYIARCSTNKSSDFACHMDNILLKLILLTHFAASCQHTSHLHSTQNVITVKWVITLFQNYMLKRPPRELALISHLGPDLPNAATTDSCLSWKSPSLLRWRISCFKFGKGSQHVMSHTSCATLDKHKRETSRPLNQFFFRR